jgi:DNA-binding MarR family transcriptional regulator
LLGHVFENQNNKKCVSIKEIIFTRRFGTEKTTHRKIKELERLGYLLLLTASDRRVKEIRVTDRGSDLLKKIANELRVVD